MGRPRKTIVQPIKIRTFEECYDEILSIINTRRFKWHLTSVPAVSWEDISQIILAHIFRKFHLYDQSRSLKSWVMVVATNQILNQLRNLYGNFQKICIRCPFDAYEGDNLCKKFGTCDSSKCDLLKAWETRKKPKHDINLPLPLENHINECQEIQSQNIDVEKSATNLHIKMKEILKPLEWLVYDMAYIKHMPDEQISSKLQFRSTEKNRVAGYGRLNQLKKLIIIQVKKVLQDGDIEIVGDNNV